MSFKASNIIYTVSSKSLKEDVNFILFAQTGYKFDATFWTAACNKIAKKKLNLQRHQKLYKGSTQKAQRGGNGNSSPKFSQQMKKKLYKNLRFFPTLHDKENIRSFPIGSASV